MNQNLSGTQFRTVAEVGKMKSGDHGVTMNQYSRLPNDTKLGMRYDRHDMQGLVDDVKANGVHTPISIYKGDTGKDEVGDGHHRFLAAKRAGLTHIPVEYDKLSQEGK